MNFKKSILTAAISILVVFPILSEGTTTCKTHNRSTKRGRSIEFRPHLNPHISGINIVYDDSFTDSYSSAQSNQDTRTGNITVTYDYNTIDNTAKANIDYIPIDGSVEFTWSNNQGSNNFDNGPVNNQKLQDYPLYVKILNSIYSSSGRTFTLKLNNPKVAITPPFSGNWHLQYSGFNNSSPETLVEKDYLNSDHNIPECINIKIKIKN